MPTLEVPNYSNGVEPCADEATLRRLYLDEWQSMRSIARRIGCSERAVLNALRHYGIPRRERGRARAISHARFTPRTLHASPEDYRVAVEGGLTTRQMALSLGVTHPTVQRDLQYLGLSEKAPERQYVWASKYGEFFHSTDRCQHIQWGSVHVRPRRLPSVRLSRLRPCRGCHQVKDLGGTIP